MSATEPAPGVAALRRQVATLQLELAETEQKLEKERAERDLDADRLSDMLARLNKMSEEVRVAGELTRRAEGNAAAAQRKAEIDDAGARAANDALADAERRAGEELDKLARLSAELENEKATSQWLRTAGEQTTRETTTLRARLAEEESKGQKERAEAASAHRAVVDELTANAARLREVDRERQAAIQELAAERAGEAERRTAEEKRLAWAIDEERASQGKELEAARNASANALEATRQAASNELETTRQAGAKALEEARREAAEALERLATRTGKELEDARAGRRAAEEARESLEGELASARGAVTDAERLRDETGRELLLAREAREVEKQRASSLEESLTVAAADADRTLAAARAERDEAERKLKEADEGRAALSAELAATMERLAGLSQALEALEQTEGEVAKLHAAAAAARQTAREHTSAMVQARDRASRPGGVLDIPEPRASEVDSAWDVPGGDGDD